MSEAVSLLPQNATPLETALTLTNAARRPLPDDLPRQFWNPDECPAHLLGWLALQFSVDIWNEAWPDARKRYVIKRSIELHRKKGTEYAIREYLALADTPAVKVVTPPQGFFVAQDLSQDQFAAWLASLPEIRLYKLRGGLEPSNIVAAQGGSLVCEAMFLSDGAADGVAGFCLPDPLSLSVSERRKAVLIENGVETELGIDGRNEIAELAVERFFIPRGTAGLFAPEGAFLDECYLIDDAPPPDDLVAVRRTGALAWWNLAYHGREPINALPVKVKQRVADSGSFLVEGAFLDHCYLTPYDSDRYVYDSWRLAARGRVPDLPNAASFLDYSRWSIDAYTAEVTVDLRRRGPAGAWFINFPGDWFLTDPDTSDLTTAIRAINAARSARDRILIDTIADPAATFATAAAINDLDLN